MAIRLFFILQFLFSTSEASVVGFARETIVIPCSSEEIQPTTDDITVFWRHNSLNVFDIIGGKDSVETQHPAYKNRAETFPKEYEKGNFSLKLSNLQFRDSGTYTCYIIEESKQQSVRLLIEERPIRERFNGETKPEPEMNVIICMLGIEILLSLANSATWNVPVPSPKKGGGS